MKNGCEICNSINDDLEWDGYTDGYQRVMIKNKKLIIVDDDLDEEDWARMDIDYCPFCGRKLNNND